MAGSRAPDRLKRGSRNSLNRSKEHRHIEAGLSDSRPVSVKPLVVLGHDQGDDVRYVIEAVRREGLVPENLFKEALRRLSTVFHFERESPNLLGPADGKERIGDQIFSDLAAELLIATPGQDLAVAFGEGHRKPYADFVDKQPMPKLPVKPLWHAGSLS